MEEELRKLLGDIVEQRNINQDTIEKMKLDIERSQNRQKDAVERFEQEFLGDVASGIYSNITDGNIKSDLESGKNSINERYQAEQKELENKIQELNQNEENEKDSQYRNIMLALRNYRDDMMKQQHSLDTQLKDLEEEKNAKMNTLSNEIQQLESRHTHLVMQNRNTLDLQNDNAQEIMQLDKQIEELKLQAKSVDSNYNMQIEALTNKMQDFNVKIENVSQFFGQIDLKTKNPKEIYEIIFGNIQEKEEIKEENKESEVEKIQEELVQEEPKQEEPEQEELPQIEWLKMEPQKVEEPKVEEPKVEEPKVEEPKVEEPKVEEPKVERSKIEEPEILRRKKEQPKVEQPKVERSKIEEPEILRRKKEQPKVEEPKVERSKIEEPEILRRKKEQPKVEEPKVEEPKVEQPKVKEPKKDEEFSYQFSANGIVYDGKELRPDKLLKLYNTPRYQKSINEAIKNVLKDKEDKEKFIDYSDRLIYLSIIYTDAQIDNRTNKLILGEKATKRLKEYYNIWENPKRQEKSNMTISYDFKGLTPLSRETRKSGYSEELQNIRANAYAQRRRKNIQIENKGALATIQFGISDMVGKISDFGTKFKTNFKSVFKKVLLLDQAQQEYEEEYYEDPYYEEVDTKPSKSFRKNIKEQAENIKGKMTYEPKYMKPKDTKAPSKSKEDKNNKER